MLDLLFSYTVAAQEHMPLPPLHQLQIERQVERSAVLHGDYVELAREKNVPWEGGRSILIGDRATGEVMMAHREVQMLPMASLTKLMTVIVALERYGDAQIIPIPREATQVEGAKASLLAGDALSVRELVRACMIRSGNDAAYALAAYAPGGMPTFVAWMNEKAQALGLEQTHFANSIGLDAPDHFSTAKDLFALARYAIDTHPLVLESASQKESLVTGMLRSYPVKSTNALLGDGLFQVLGLKTGTTDGAGQSFIGLFRLPNGQEVISVMLGSNNRFGETKAIVAWLWEQLRL